MGRSSGRATVELGTRISTNEVMQTKTDQEGRRSNAGRGTTGNDRLLLSKVLAKGICQEVAYITDSSTRSK